MTTTPRPPAPITYTLMLDGLDSEKAVFIGGTPQNPNPLLKQVLPRDHWETHLNRAAVLEIPVYPIFIGPA